VKTPLLNDKPDEPTPNRFRLPSWWPAETDRGMNRSWWICIMTVPFAGVIIELASGEWLGALAPLAIGLAMVAIYRKVGAGERLLDEVERKDALDERARHDREERELYLESLSALDVDED
jgi:hypothetical protein